ncbi:MAG: c-type cytochrome [Pseudomonadota bacterium]
MALPLAGCGRPAEAPAPSAASQAAARLPDARLAAVYERACMSCHEAAGSGAPLRGDRAAWAPREAAGLGALVASVRQGKGTMPPMGWCPECTDEDFAVLISHLTTSPPQ